MKEKITNTAEFRRWVRMQVVSKEISMAELARQMEIPQARISDAIHGGSTGNKFIIPIIRKLDGDEENFKEFLKAI